MKINSIQTFIDATKNIASKWDPETTPWFRGEPIVNTALLPSLYRPVNGGKKLDENYIVQYFRRLAREYCNSTLPDRGNTEEWLFLMQHLRVPTRLLDWTEGALIGLFFALQFKRSVVWMLNPDELNQLTDPGKVNPGNYFLTWHLPVNNSINILNENLRGAWESNRRGVELPIAIKPAYIHPRMSAQKSCFTVHGFKKESLNKLVPKSILAKFEIQADAVPEMLKDLKMLGITQSTLFPELENFGKELVEIAKFRAK